jgi:ribonuclease HI
VTDLETMEVMACREGLALATDLGLQDIWLASDCLNAVRSIQEGRLGPYGKIIKEIRSSLLQFSKSKVVHEGRDANADAYRLAKSATYCSLGRHVWFLDPSEGVCNSYITQ